MMSNEVYKDDKTVKLRVWVLDKHRFQTSPLDLNLFRLIIIYQPGRLAFVLITPWIGRKLSR